MTSKFIPQIDNEEEPRIPIFAQLGVLAGILLLIFGSGFVPKVLESISASKANESSEAAVYPQVKQSSSPAIPVDYFDELSIRAEAAYVWDVQNQSVLFAKNDHEQLPLASVTKLMTALVAYEILADDAAVPVTVNSIMQEGNSGLSEGDLFTLNNLLDLTLLSSSNDGAHAVATAVGATLSEDGDAGTFVKAMNIRASELGLNQTYFKNPTGLDISTDEGGAYGSARDIAYLMEFILRNYPGILEHTQKDSSVIANASGATHSVRNTNPTVSRINGLIGSKTGYTDLAGGNLAIAFDAAYNRPIVVVVLGSTYAARFEDVLALSAAARKTVQ